MNDPNRIDVSNDKKQKNVKINIKEKIKTKTAKKNIRRIKKPTKTNKA